MTWRENLNKNNILKIIVFVHFLFFAHLLVAAFFCIIAVFLMAMPWRGVKVWIVRSLPIFSVIPIALAWIAIGFFTAPNASDPIIWLFGINRVIEFLPGLVSAPPNSIGFIIGAFFLILPWLYGATPRYSWVAWGPFFIYFFWMLLVPHYVGGNYFTYQRFGIFGLPLYCLGFEIKGKYISHNMKYIIKIGVAAIGILMIAWQCIRVDIFNSEIKEYQRVIHSAEPGQRMVMMIFDKMSRSNVSAPLMLHLAGWYQAEQHGLAEFNFARFWGMPLKYKDNIGPGIYSGFEWYPENFDWDKNDGENIQYLILRHPYDASAWISEKTYGNMSLLARDGPWQLYSKVKK